MYEGNHFGLSCTQVVCKVNGEKGIGSVAPSVPTPQMIWSSVFATPVVKCWPVLDSSAAYTELLRQNVCTKDRVPCRFIIYDNHQLNPARAHPDHQYTALVARGTADCRGSSKPIWKMGASMDVEKTSGHWSSCAAWLPLKGTLSID